jgi:hypothetical protein
MTSSDALFFVENRGDVSSKGPFINDAMVKGWREVVKVFMTTQ